MEKFMKIPFIIPFLGIMAGIALLITVAYNMNTNLLITGLILFHVSAWVLAARFLFSAAGFFSSVLDKK